MSDSDDHEFQTRLAGLGASLNGRSIGDEYLKLHRRRSFLKRGALIAGVGLSSTLGVEMIQPAHADVMTAAGETRTVSFAQTELLVGPLTALNLRDDASQPSIELLSGRVLGSCPPDASPPLLRITGRFGAVLSARQSFCLHLSRKEFTAASPDNACFTARSGRTYVLAAGTELQMTGEKIVMAPKSWGASSAWKNGFLVCQDAPLGRLLDNLSAYWSGYIYASNEIRARRVSGSFSVSNPMQTLLEIGSIYNVVVRQYPFGVVYLS
ncbi:hypothetical protein J2D73_12320 [Acetobacter sacchari]|uniref:Uncharacterized protein n=1 Tax=Acetobacter sacchari TaxID=2661687 RepID=A0ABS3LXF0_9PROT|nr:hypothetical protein [Acetobacter sacchari]MBO1360573.1 hypothetical protein [Acetobacter sacchari]